MPWRPLTRGRGAIVMLHHVRPWIERPFAPNRLLEIEPTFLDAALARMTALGFDFVTMDEALGRIRAGAGGRPFVALTFDDGYRDTLDHALPVLERHAAPFTLYVTNGFADRSARLWWVELEEAIRILDRVAVDHQGTRVLHLAATPVRKQAAFDAAYRSLRAGDEAALLSTIARLRDQAGLRSADIVERLCLDWAGIARLAAHPLCTIGVHTMTHPMLAKHGADIARRELRDSRDGIEAAIGRPARPPRLPGRRPRLRRPARLRHRRSAGLRQRRHDAARHGLPRPSAPRDRPAAPVAERPLAKPRQPRRAAVRRALRAVEQGTPRRRLKRRGHQARIG